LSNDHDDEDWLEVAEDVNDTYPSSRDSSTSQRDPARSSHGSFTPEEMEDLYIGVEEAETFIGAGTLGVSVVLNTH
jgi:hypothetical protein